MNAFPELGFVVLSGIVSRFAGKGARWRARSAS